MVWVKHACMEIEPRHYCALLWCNMDLYYAKFME